MLFSPWGMIWRSCSSGEKFLNRGLHKTRRRKGARQLLLFRMSPAKGNTGAHLPSFGMAVKGEQRWALKALTIMCSPEACLWRDPPTGGMVATTQCSAAQMLKTAHSPPLCIEWLVRVCWEKQHSTGRCVPAPGSTDKHHLILIAVEYSLHKSSSTAYGVWDSGSGSLFLWGLRGQPFRSGNCSHMQQYSVRKICLTCWGHSHLST